MQRICKEPDCDRSARSRGWCPMHYKRWWSGKPVAGPSQHQPVTETERFCMIDGCRRRLAARGWCAMHYLRWKEGRPMLDPPPADSAFDRCLVGDGCWEWQGALTTSGYGQLTYRQRRYMAHRRAWEEWHQREIPVGLVVMHLCDNPRCIRPDHLQLGTDADNVHDAIRKGRNTQSVPKATCTQGHEYTPENTYVLPSGRRRCRECRRRWYDQRRAA